MVVDRQVENNVQIPYSKDLCFVSMVLLLQSITLSIQLTLPLKL